MSVDQLQQQQHHDSPRKATKKRALDAQPKNTWGRYKDVDNLTVLLSLCILLFCPLMVVYFYSACNAFNCSLLAPVYYLSSSSPPSWAVPTTVSPSDAKSLLASPALDKLLFVFPSFDDYSLKLFLGWVVFQGLLYAFLPAKIGYGQQTPAGFILPYKVNGLLAWVVTHVAFYFLTHHFQIVPASIIARNWGGLLIAANIYGYALTAFSYAKAHLFPSHPEDRKFSGSVIYDLFMGIEFNPRFGKYWDFKLFHNGRPGIVAWTLINWSFAARQYEVHGYVSNSMLLLNFLHAVYVLDFFYNEDWYLRTIDIAHDHFGFYLSWGDSVWLPFMYTLQSHYLLQNPTPLSTPYFLAVLTVGLSGYYIFRAVNHQKDIVRSTDGDCLIWGKKPTVIRTKYITSDGKEHRSLLLASGFWGK
ncbi:ergosterol biosynthesis ERG4/ERG24 family-domain-containing protein [Paraphysoderma sedebokerense]|nr:ergosterol biosynthesis ERG4/ERG24 family-domain-containing protein [Paraphysoderma sedebokerense]